MSLQWHRRGGGGGRSAACFPGEAGLPPRLLLMRFAGFVMGTLGTLLYGRGDAAERQRVFERDPRASGPARRRRRQRRTGGRRDGDGAARREVSSDFETGAFARDGDAASDGDVEAFAPRASRSGRLTSSGGFGSPVGVSGALDPNLDDAFLFDEMRIDARRSETGFGSGSLRSSMAFSSFGATPLAAPRDARPARRPGRAGTVEADASSPARVVEGFAEDARKGRGRDGAT